ncbi:hypothetical protein PflQ2_1000 [Pseudomonas fluorescens Q2-87]|uniref:Uncharacterized protein n=1 Tax=Pseudomonas fluorescens (strain Q2-87) TaxID=1038922 RepID=J2F5A8_PSEFQ|nr:hypothetical protein PflQ2_1000 [Pseudomonas fluorescens Q2-87]
MHFWSLHKAPEGMKPTIVRTLFLNTALIVPSQRCLGAVAVESSHELSVGKP